MKSAKKSVHVVVQLVVTVVRSHRAGGMANPAPAPAGAFPSEGLPPDADAADLVLPAVEMDTADDEEASSSWEALRSTLLPPDGASLPTTADGTFIPAFALLVNGSALNAWVKQPSPSCAAAVVAGAWNALACAGGRRDARAMGVRDVLDAMALGAETNLARRKARFARLLGVSSDAFDAFERAVLERIASDPSGATLGGGASRPRDAPRRRDARRRGRRRRDARRRRPSANRRRNRRDDVSSIEETCHDADDAFAAVAALLREEKAVRMTKTKTQENAASSSSENEPAFAADEKSRERRRLCSPKQKKKPEVARTEKRLAKNSRPSRRRSHGSGLPARRFSARRQESSLEISASQTTKAPTTATRARRARRPTTATTTKKKRALVVVVVVVVVVVRLARRDVVRAEGARGFGETTAGQTEHRGVRERGGDARVQKARRDEPKRARARTKTETENRLVFSARVAFGIKTKTRPSLEAARSRSTRRATRRSKPLGHRTSGARSGLCSRDRGCSWCRTTRTTTPGVRAARTPRRKRKRRRRARRTARDARDAHRAARAETRGLDPLGRGESDDAALERVRDHGVRAARGVATGT